MMSMVSCRLIQSDIMLSFVYPECRK